MALGASACPHEDGVETPVPTSLADNERMFALFAQAEARLAMVKQQMALVHGEQPASGGAPASGSGREDLIALSLICVSIGTFVFCLSEYLYYGALFNFEINYSLFVHVNMNEPALHIRT